MQDPRALHPNKGFLPITGFTCTRFRTSCRCCSSICCFSVTTAAVGWLAWPPCCQKREATHMWMQEICGEEYLCPVPIPPQHPSCLAGMHPSWGKGNWGSSMLGTATETLRWPQPSRCSECSAKEALVEFYLCPWPFTSRSYYAPTSCTALGDYMLS